MFQWRAQGPFIVGNSQESHQEWNEAVTSPLKDLQKCGKEWSTKSESNQPALNCVCDEQSGSHLVKPMSFLENEGLISGEWDTWDSGDEEQNSGEEKRLDDLWPLDRLATLERSKPLG